MSIIFGEVIQKEPCCFRLTRAKRILSNRLTKAGFRPSSEPFYVFLAQLSHCAYAITFCKSYMFTDLPDVPPTCNQGGSRLEIIAQRCTPLLKIRMDQDCSPPEKN